MGSLEWPFSARFDAVLRFKRRWSGVGWSDEDEIVVEIVALRAMRSVL